MLNIFRSKILIAVTAIVLWAAGSFAVQETPAYPLHYGVMGTLQKGGASAVEGYSVILYKVSGDPSHGYAIGVTDATGKFNLNPFDDIRLDPKPGVDYYIGIIAKDGFGVSKSTIQLNLDGYTEINTLTLAANKGVGDPNGGSLTLVVQDSASASRLAGVLVEIQGTGLFGTTDANGNVTVSNLPPGTYTVNFSKDGYNSASAQVTIKAGEPTTIEGGITLVKTGAAPTSTVSTVTISPASISLAPGAKQTFTAKGYDSAGSEVAGTTFTWSITDGDAGTIDSAGSFTASSKSGTYSNAIKATSGSISAYASVNISSETPVLTSITVTPASISLLPGASFTFTANGYDQAGMEMPNTKINWSNENSAAGTIDSNGVFFAGKITGTYNKEIKASSAINNTIAGYSTVEIVASNNPPALTTIAVTPPTVSLLAGGTQLFAAKGYDQFNNEMPNTAFTWSVANTTAGAIDSGGLFTASQTAGSYAKAVQATSGNVNSSADITVTAAAAGLLKIISGSLTEGVLPSAEVNLGYLYQLEASGGSGSYLWTWTGNTPPGLTLDSSGLVQGTPASPGDFSFTITLKDSAGNVVSSDLKMTVKAKVIPVGTVPISISRDNTNVYLSWDSNTYNQPIIFVLTGDGSGQFNNTYDGSNWIKVAENGALAAGVTGYAYSEGKLTHQSQVAAGNAEAYYKAVVKGTDPAAIKTPLESALTVGKINYTFNPGNTYFNYPFLNSMSFDNILGTAGFTSLSKILDYQKATDNFNTSTFSNNSWQNPFVMQLGKGYVFFNYGASQTKTTLVGELNNSPDTFSLSVTGGNNYIGLPFPVKKTLSQAFGSSPLKNDGLLIYKSTTDNFEKKSCPSDGSFEDGLFEINPFSGYVYFKYGDSFNWQPKP